MRKIITLLGSLCLLSCNHQKTTEEIISEQSKWEIEQMRKGFQRDSTIMVNALERIMNAEPNSSEQYKLIDQFNYDYGLFMDILLDFNCDQRDCNIKKHEILSNMHSYMAMMIRERGKEIADSLRNAEQHNK